MRWLTVLMVGVMAAGAAGAAALELTKDGASAHVIVVPDDAIPSVRTAATELQSHLESVTGAQLPIRTEAEVAPDVPQISLGLTARFRQAFPDFDPTSLGSDGIVMKTAGASLYLAGDEPRGTLYAVYTFLEDEVGCRWWSSRESFIPKKPTLVIEPLDFAYTPKLMSREAFYRDAANGPFSARLKCNGHFHQVPEEYGGHHSILGWCHTFYQILPPEKYFADHPEWFSEIDGKRVWENAQLCLTNPEMRAEFLKNALGWLRNRPDANADIISISQNDWHGRCQCPACKAVEEREGAPSGLLVEFVNAMAEGIEKEFPDVLVETLAYQYTREAPLHVRPRKNVVIRLCSIECSFAEPLATGPENASFKRDIDAWNAIAPQLYIWDYVTNFSEYILPHPNLRVLAPNIRLFVEKKAVGLFEQGDTGSSCSDFPELRAWLLAHLMWDPSRDDRALMAEFLNGYYGPAAEPLQAYIDLMCDAVEKSGAPLRCFMEDRKPWLSIDDMARANGLFDDAMARVGDDATLRARVRRARLPLDNAWLNRYHSLLRTAKARNMPFPGPADPVAFANDFVETAKSFDVGSYREGRPFSEYEAILRNRFRAPGPPPDLCKGLPAGDWVDVQDNEFKLFERGRYCDIVDDPAASDGKAARLTTDHTQWAVQLPVPDEAAALGTSKCYVVVRCESGAAAGPGFDLGLYDSEKNVGLTSLTIPIEEAGAAYRVYELGEHKLTPQTYVWVAPKANADAVKGIYVDRVFFIRSK